MNLWLSDCKDLLRGWSLIWVTQLSTKIPRQSFAIGDKNYTSLKIQHKHIVLHSHQGISQLLK